MRETPAQCEPVRQRRRERGPPSPRFGGCCPGISARRERHRPGLGRQVVGRQSGRRARPHALRTAPRCRARSARRRTADGCRAGRPGVHAGRCAATGRRPAAPRCARTARHRVQTSSSRPAAVQQAGRDALREGLADHRDHRHAGPQAPRRRWCGHCTARRRGTGRRRPAASGAGRPAARARTRRRSAAMPRCAAAATSAACTLAFQRSSHSTAPRHARAACGTRCRTPPARSCTTGGSRTAPARRPAAPQSARRVGERHAHAALSLGW